MKKQIIVIHGGTTFENYDEYWKYLESCELTPEKIKHKGWKEFLQDNLPDFDVIYPKMPNAKNARYLEWKLWFEKMFHFLNDEVILVGHSLGGIFLAKYLTENEFPKKIIALHLVAPPYDTEHCEEPLVDFALEKTVGGLAELTDKIYIYQSKDDPAVPYEDSLKYKKNLPDAEHIVFENRGHFNDPDFPEIINNLQK